jgi:hypothetical protein
MTRKVADSPRSLALRFALVIGSSRKSRPVTLWLRLAKKRAFSPVPQPTSRTEPVIRSAFLNSEKAATISLPFGGEDVS